MIEPDRVDDAFHDRVEIGVFEDHERGLATQLQRQPLPASSGCLPDDAPDVRRTGECDLVYVRVIDQSGTGLPVAGDDVHDAGR